MILILFPYEYFVKKEGILRKSHSLNVSNQKEDPVYISKCYWNHRSYIRECFYGLRM